MGEVLPFRPRAGFSVSARPPQAPTTPVRRPRPDAPLLWREAVGQVLRQRRRQRDETLAQVAARAGVSVPYLSEIERGRKEPSSELLAAVAGALDLALAELAVTAAARLRPLDLTSDRRPGPPGRPHGPVALAV